MRPSRLFLAVSYATLITPFVAGCAVGPDFKTPSAPDVNSYESSPLQDSTEQANSASGAAQKFVTSKDIPAAWWGLFHSEALNQLITNAIKSNPDIAAAEATLRMAEENTTAADGSLFPTLSGSFSSTREKTAGASFGGDFPGSIYTLHNASVNVSYGIDVFGGVRRQIEGLDAQKDYERFQLEATYLSLTGNIVTAAIQESSLRGQIAATEKIIAEQAHQLDLTKQQHELGGVSQLAVLSQQTNLQQTKATLPPLQAQLAATRHQLSVLGGQFPSQEPEAVFELNSLKLPEEIPVSLPSKLVEQRPDIRAAEANLHVASAAIGAAEANRLPQITLSADIGSMANKLQRLFTPGGGIWSFGADATQTLFDAGTLEHKQHSAEAEYDAVAAQYRKTVLVAFQNVADTLHALTSDAETLKEQAEAERSAVETLTLSQKQFDAGAISYLSLLSAEQSEQTAKIALIKAEAQRLSDTAALFEALGGGWWNREPDNATHTTDAPHQTETAHVVLQGE